MAKRGRKPKNSLNLKMTNFAGVWRSLVALSLLVFGVISFISIFLGIGTDSGGQFNSYLRMKLVDYFGFISLLVPLMIIYLSILIIGTVKFGFLKYKYLVISIVMYIGLSGVFGKFAGKMGEVIQGRTAYYISAPGAIVLYLVVMVMTMVIATNKGIDVWIKGLYNFIGIFIDKVLRIKPPETEKEAEQLEIQSAEISNPMLIAPDEDRVASKVKQYQQQFEISNGNDQDEFVSPDVSSNAKTKKEEKMIEIINPPSAPIGEEESLHDFVNEPSKQINLGTLSEKAEINIPDDLIGEIEQLSSHPRLPFSNKLWEYPSIDLLANTPNVAANAGDVNERKHKIEQTLNSFGIQARVVDLHIGPAVTQYAISIPEGSKAAKIVSLSTDIALRIKSPSGSVRIEAPIPGSEWIGIEVPNYSPSTVSLRSVLETTSMKGTKSKLSVPIGMDVTGRPVIEDISKWPHCLVAGATGSGKSVMLNAIITSLLFRCSPQECKLIMIDPKMVEMIAYAGIPHLLCPVITDVEQKAVSALAWAVSEMERRYKQFSALGVKNLEGYNAMSGFQAEPYIVIVIDELAELMMVASTDVERYIARLAQKARATGIHLIVATQRPSVNVLTGTIKANIPTRIAFKVTSNVDSRVILDQAGAETLIGRGDMLYIPPNDSKPRRIQGVYVADSEINSLVNYLKSTGVEPDYKEEILEQKVGSLNSFNGSGGAGADGLVDDKLVDALTVIMQDGRASASYLQRRISLGYSRAARMIDDMTDAGIIGRQNGSKPREIIVTNIDDAIARLKELYAERSGG